MLWEDFPGGPAVENSPCNAKDSGSIPGQETKIPHALEQLSLRSTTMETSFSEDRASQGKIRMMQRKFCVLQLSPDEAK